MRLTHGLGAAALVLALASPVWAAGSPAPHAAPASARPATQASPLASPQAATAAPQGALAPSAVPSGAPVTSGAATGPSGAASPSPTPWLSPVPSEEPFKPGGGPDLPIGAYLLQLILVTGIVGGLGYVAVRLVKGRVPGLGGAGIGRTDKLLNVVERLVVDPQRTLMVVNVGSRYWLLAATAERVTTVAELNKNDLGGEFATYLEQETHRGEI